MNAPRMPDQPTSLVTEGESVYERCPKQPYDVVDLLDPALRFPSTCRTYRCEFCGPVKARQKALIVSWARPERFVTLTLAPESWQALRQRVRRLTMQVRRAGYTWEVAWTVERGSKTGMIHVHQLQHGSYVPQQWLQQKWGAIVDIRAIKQAKGAAKYVLKEAEIVTRYALKGTRDFQTHLDNNGGRALHMSRGYLRGMRTADVLAAIYGESDLSVPHEWALVPVGAKLNRDGTTDWSKALWGDKS
jgi:hypothetical protein